MTRRVRSALLATLLLAGCTTVGPDYHRPDAAVVARPSATGSFVGANEAAFDPGPVPDHWWKLYDDPRLDALIEDGMRNNTDLRVAAANIARARAGLDRANDGRHVQTDVQTSLGAARPSPEGELMPNANFPPFLLYSGGVSVSYQLDLFGQVRRAVEAAGADLAATRAAQDNVRVTVAADIVSAYVEACAAGEDLEVAERALAVQQREAALTARMIRAGRGITTELTRSRAQESQVKATIPGMIAARQVALYRLATLTGHPPAAFDRSVATCRDVPRVMRPIPVGDGAALLRRRPDVRGAEWALRAATARIGVATANLYPQVNLGGAVGSTGLDSHALAGDTLKFSLGPLISWQFPNRTRVRASIADAQAQADAAYARFDGTVLTALREVESALSVYARDLDAHAALTEAQRQTARAARDADMLYRRGRTGFLPRLDAQRAMVTADRAVAQSKARLAADQVRLFLALGGGWQ
ncbi:efflux transporter outer membrane subunit [Sphingomonadaceae bacterium jetA1]|jgi:NodT family efflux transporter outer membrane factor (OMF) lipoprotein|uniref:efflux transporter outer membrane subunit n=1 Tax=Facivitalis istanbulensis TaxID=3075838 RepID=UPI003487E074